MRNIIIVDMQKGFINENTEHLIEKINNYLKANKFDNVFYTRYLNYEDSMFVKYLNWKEMFDEDNQKIVVDVLPNSTIFNKYGYGLTTEMINEIKKRNIDEIEVCGVNTDACVLAIMFNLFDNNINPIVNESLCGSSIGNDYHLSALKVISGSFCKGIKIKRRKCFRHW